jgi:hypothetical protein
MVCTLAPGHFTILFKEHSTLIGLIQDIVNDSASRNSLVQRTIPDASFTPTNLASV